MKKKYQADIGKIKKTLSGQIVVHPKTAHGPENGLKYKTGLAKSED
ncbi:DUF2810 domain-containing protein [Salmonella enterica subsp. enterica serovar Infantis]